MSSTTPAPVSAAALAEVLPLGVLLAGDDGRVLYANPALVEIFDGVPPGHTLGELARLTPYGKAEALWSAGDDRRVRCTLPDGRVLEGVWHRLAEGRSLTVADATSDALIRQRLRQHNRALAELVATKTELVSALLHEVRTPLTAARTMASLLPSAPDDPVAGALERNLGRLEAVTREIATISGIENGTLDVRVRPVDLDELLRSVAASLSPPAVVVSAGQAVAAGDPTLLGEVFARLITAVRAIAGGDLVEAFPGDGQWRLSLPLPASTAADRLFTATNATALMFARAVIGRHGGSVGIEHSRLTVRLPTATPSGPPPGSAVPAG
ncbi:PAS domain-containing sensor histidine kinase [Actinoplanes sp. NPDC051411]|uniref:sensor histidine kinase n=1 Tax=Actinoplanes sp. NPDC051411 TaxID=3155522 RepID=UPI0034437E3C